MHCLIHLELLPYISIIGEFIIKLRCINYIIDIDDDVYHRYTNKNKVIDYLVKKKFNYIIKNAYSMYAGNDYHKKFFNSINNNIKVIPTTLDTNNYKKNISKIKYKKVTIVWIGTPSTSIY